MTVAVPQAQATLTEWLDYWSSIHVTAIDLGLERIRPVAEYLQLLAPTGHVVTVAGTNGKGSTTTIISAIYQAAGQRVGLYQSPHITHFNERVRIDGQPVNDALLIAAFEQVEAARVACDLPLSFFEATTLAAFVIFAQQQCDVWVLEVGLGGRLDAVNLIDPNVAVMTNIGLDHTDWLGDTIEKIAFEKAGIMRIGIPVVWGDPTERPAMIDQRARDLGCRLICAGQDFLATLDAQGLYYAAPACTLHLPVPQLAAVNVASAITAVLVGPIAVSVQAIAIGMTSAHIAGRFEHRLWHDRDVILDVAHNVHGMRFLWQQIGQWKTQHQRETAKIHLVFSMLDDKDIEGVVQMAAADVDHWHLAALTVPRAASLARLQQAVLPYAQSSYATLKHALHGAIQQSQRDDLIVVCGSFYALETVWEAITQHEQ